MSKTYICTSCQEPTNRQRHLCSKCYYKNNKEKHRALTKAYYEKHSEAIKAYGRQWYAQNKARRNKKASEHYAKNKADYLERTNRRRNKIRQSFALLPPALQEEIRAIYNNCPKGYHVDHIIPLKGSNVSGLHVPWNLQYLPAEANLKKGSKCLGL